MEDKRTVLIMNGQYAPGYKGGGPIQSCINMVENLYQYFDFKVLCADRDYKEEKPYPNVKVNEWNQVGHAQVYYANASMQTISGLKEILTKTKYDILYLNGFFSPIFTIRPLVLKKLKKLENKKVILTPRGDFTGGCETKKIKKYIFIYLMKFIGMYSKLYWHATSDIEERAIKRKFPKANIFMVPNISTKFEKKEIIIHKKVGKLKLIFISRISPKKNLKYALEVLKEIYEGEIIFDIYGPIENKDYWIECKNVIKEMPTNVKVRYCGEVLHNQVPHIFKQYHAFFFPTLGENYGHVIVEAMMNNCLCILSRGVTPWDDYIDALGIGAKIGDIYKFMKIIKKMVMCDEMHMKYLRELAYNYVKEKVENINYIKLYVENFNKL